TATGGSGTGGARSGSAQAFSSATGTSGLSQARATTGSFIEGNYVSVNARAVLAGNAPGGVIATSRSEAGTNEGESVADRTQLEGLQAGAFATLLPSAADAVTLLVGNTSVEVAMLNKQALATGLLGGSFSENGSATTGQLYTSSADFNIDMTDKVNTDLLVGLLDPVAVGDHGFDSLRVRLNIEGQQTTDLTFTDLLTAEAFLDDNALNFGLWADLISSDNVLDIEIILDITEQHLGEGFSTNFIVGGGVSAVPVPGAVWLFGSGLLGLLVAARRRR
ncbi:hypothetical protein MNBD_GAMMA10-100, partial [hydrothermal vent metagenome]